MWYWLDPQVPPVERAHGAVGGAECVAEALDTVDGWTDGWLDGQVD